MIRGILFDSGFTLARPLGGRWFPGHRFAGILSAHGLPLPAPPLLDEATGAGLTYLSGCHNLHTVAEERQQFTRFYEIILEQLMIEPEPALLQALVTAMVDQPDFAFYDDTIAALHHLRQRGLRLAIVSDAWPSLERKYIMLGARPLFDGFVLSARTGCTKPCPQIFQAGLSALNLSAEETMFVDDWPDYVRAAQDLGLSAILMDRENNYTDSGLTRVTSMQELTKRWEY